jgi:hypothetical protein
MEFGPFLTENTLFRGEGAIFPRELKPYFQNLLTITIIPFLNYIHACYLSLERFQGELQLCSWKHFNQNSYAKSMITQSFEHICCLREHGCSLDFVNLNYDVCMKSMPT